MDALQHTAEIISSRAGGFGGSDAKLFYKIGTRGLNSLSNSDKKRISIAKGIEEYKPITQTESMLRGHEFESWYETQLVGVDYEREPKLSKQMADNFDTFFHADFYVSEKEIRELKCLSEPKKAYDTYYYQLQWQIMIFDLPVYLICCDSNFDNFSDGILPPLRCYENENIISALKKGIKLLDEAWDTIDLTVGEDWQEEDLMYFEQPEVMALATYLNEIKALEKQAEEQKEKVLQLMLDNNIKSLSSDYYSITLITEGQTSTFDKKKLLADHPQIDAENYTKVTVRKPYIKVTLR